MKIIGCLSQVFFPIVSTIFCGHLGETELDGVSLANSVCILFFFKQLTKISSNLILKILKLIYVLVLTCSEGLTTACDTLFPQVNFCS